MVNPMPDGTAAPDEVIHFTQCLPPFVGLHRFVIQGREEEAPFQWLQSVEQPALTLIIALYEELTGEPAPTLPPDLAAELGLEAGDAPLVYVIISPGATPEAATVNLLAPIYLNRRTLRARQVILDGELTLTRVPLFSNSVAA
jgi:flagellar assembly factor FliW